MTRLGSTSQICKPGGELHRASPLGVAPGEWQTLCLPVHQMVCVTSEANGIACVELEEIEPTSNTCKKEVGGCCGSETAAITHAGSTSAEHT